MTPRFVESKESSVSAEARRMKWYFAVAFAGLTCAAARVTLDVYRAGTGLPGTWFHDKRWTSIGICATITFLFALMCALGALPEGLMPQAILRVTRYLWFLWFAMLLVCVGLAIAGV